MPSALRFPLQLAAAALSGVLLWAAFPDQDLWWLAPVAVALLGGVTLRSGGPRGLLLGLVCGLAFFVPTLSWSGIYVGRLPWFALATLQALYVAAQGAVTGFAGRRLTSAGHARAAYALVPLGWVAQEWARSTTPYGGFPWARLAFSQADSPLAHLARWLGAPGVTFAVGLVGTLLLLAATVVVRGPRRLAVVPVALAAVATLAPLAIPLPTDGRTAAVGLVQGNVPEPGLEFNAERRAVLDNHVSGTETLAETAPDDLTLVVWPENSSDIDPLRNADAAEQVQRAQRAVGVPLVVGAVLAEPVDASSNVSLLYTGGTAPADRYTKIHPVPFAEYIPHREFFRMFTSAADLAGNFVAGHDIGVFRVPAPGGGYAALPTICFEVAYDGLMRDSVAAAGSTDALVLVQTNNATFGYSAESEQQFAISRIRAIEHGRSIVHVSTVGVSGVVAPDGSVTEKTTLFTPAQAVARPVLRHERTPADLLGAAPQALAVACLVLLVVAAVRDGRRVRVARTDRSSEDHAVA
ncbi:apolipoprotein N-acyltransferase [Phycicoccus sp. CSK15P-2]|uniref:apolipoprotein N-acyltransferase n=1 Tax=Phycicoccus sp. CSK15P-2 TaxID=2807627 RepID=UPI0027DD2B36|nr:apolipoprotein N-acyltransferase [Phycicoccus sp. CSK15P-2]